MLGRASLLRYQGMSQVNKGETNRVMTTHGCRSGLGGTVREGKFLATDGGLCARAPRGERVWYGLASRQLGCIITQLAVKPSAKKDGNLPRTFLRGLSSSS